MTLNPLLFLLGYRIGGNQKRETIFEKWFGKGKSKLIFITNFKEIRKQNRIDYPNDPDVNVKREWGIRTNGARRGIDSCLDITIDIGHISIGYTDFDYAARRRAKSKH